MCAVKYATVRINFGLQKFNDSTIHFSRNMISFAAGNYQ